MITQNEATQGRTGSSTDAARKQLLVRKRDGRVVPFDRELISKAMEKAFCAEHQLIDAAELDTAYQAKIGQMTSEIADQVIIDAQSKDGADVEKIQDRVEFELMRHGFYSVARRYILYREEQARRRQQHSGDEFAVTPAPPRELMVNRDGAMESLDPKRLELQLEHACRDLPEVSADELQAEVQKQFYNGITPMQIANTMVLAARSRIENDPQYDKVAGRLTLNIIYREALGRTAVNGDLAKLYQETFATYLDTGIEAGRIDAQLRDYDLQKIAAALVPDRDDLFPYLGLAICIGVMPL